MNVAIIRISQDMDLSTGSVDNCLWILLPNGAMVRVIAAEDVVQEILKVNGASPAEPEATQKESPPAPSPKRAVRTATDEMGNPIVSAQRPMNDEVTDEDGTESI